MYFLTCCMWYSWSQLSSSGVKWDRSANRKKSIQCHVLLVKLWVMIYYCDAWRKGILGVMLWLTLEAPLGLCYEEKMIRDDLLLVHWEKSLSSASQHTLRLITHARLVPHSCMCAFRHTHTHKHTHSHANLHTRVLCKNFRDKYYPVSTMFRYPM